MTTLQSLITDNIYLSPWVDYNGRRLKLSSHRYDCSACNTSFQRSSVRSHLKSAKHRSNIGQNRAVRKECWICCTERTRFHTCRQCDKEFCTDCKGRVRRCPFCRDDLSSSRVRVRRASPRTVVPDLEPRTVVPALEPRTVVPELEQFVQLVMVAMQQLLNLQ